MGVRYIMNWRDISSRVSSKLIPKYKMEYVKRKPISLKLAKNYKVNGKIDINVIIITIDCLRKDHMSIYGYNRDTTPLLNSIKNKLAIFNNAKAASSWTWPAIASILSGLYPSRHGAKKEGDLRNMDIDKFPNKIKDNVLTLPEIFDYLGGKTYFNAGGILFAEFVTYGRFQKIDSGYRETATKQIDKLITFLRNTPEVKFVHIHIGDLHEPIYVPKTFRYTFGEVPYDKDHRKWKFRDGNIYSKEFENYKNAKLKLYDSAIRYIDNVIFNLYLYLEDTGLIKNTIVFITADHGEEFWDHVELEKKFFYDPRGYYGVGHGHNMFSEITDIPLIVFGCGIKPGYYNRLVSVVDIFPTILDLLEIEYMIEKLDGKNLFDRKQGNNLIICEDIAYGYDKKAIWVKKYKYLISPGDNVYWKFNMEKDQKELKSQILSKEEISDLYNLIGYNNSEVKKI